MAATAAAVDLRAGHAVAAVGGRADRAFDRREKAGPARAALELAIRDEERLPAARARERPGTMLVQQRARPRALGGVSAQHGVLLGREDLPPLRVRLLDR